MTNGNRYLGIALAVGIAVVAMSLTSAGPAIAQGAQKTVRALIINDAGNPVPVTGTVTTRTTEEPYNAEVQIAPASCGGPTCTQSFRFPNVPAGKRLVIRHVSAAFVLPVGATVFPPVFGIPGVTTGIIPSGTVPTTTTPTTVQIFLNASTRSTYAGNDNWAISEAVQFVVDADKAPVLFVSTDSAHVSSFVMIATIAGTLLPAS